MSLARSRRNLIDMLSSALQGTDPSSSGCSRPKSHHNEDDDEDDDDDDFTVYAAETYADTEALQTRIWSQHSALDNGPEGRAEMLRIRCWSSPASHHYPSPSSFRSLFHPPLMPCCTTQSFDDSNGYRKNIVGDHEAERVRLGTDQALGGSAQSP